MERLPPSVHGYEPHTADERYRDRDTLHLEGSVAALGRAGQVRLLLDNLTGDALVEGRTMAWSARRGRG